MTIVILIRWILFATFILLIIEGAAAVFVANWFYKLYIRKHIELEVRVLALEQKNDTTHDTPGDI